MFELRGSAGGYYEEVRDVLKACNIRVVRNDVEIVEHKRAVQRYLVNKQACGGY